MAIGPRIARRVRCNRSPNRGNSPVPAPSVKKRKTILLDQEQVKKEGLRDWEEPEDEFKGLWTTSIHHDITGTYFSSEGEDFYRPDSPYLPDSRLDDSNDGTYFSTEGDDYNLPDSCAQYKTVEVSSEDEGEEFSLPDSPYYPESRLGYNTNGTHLSLEGGDSISHHGDLCPQHKTAEGSKSEENSNAESVVDMWACSVCKAATNSTSAFPCCHLCPCWNCEFQINSCPICGVARTDGHVFTDKGGVSHPPYSPDSPQYNINGTHFASPVNKWTCHVCRAAEVSVVVLPCRHLCLCWDCCEQTDSCPICGQAKTNTFYIRNL